MTERVEEEDDVEASVDKQSFKLIPAIRRKNKKKIKHGFAHIYYLKSLFYFFSIGSSYFRSPLGSLT